MKLSLIDHSLKIVNQTGNVILIVSQTVTVIVTWKTLGNPNETVSGRRNVTWNVTLIPSESVIARNVMNLRKTMKTGFVNYARKPSGVWEKLFFARDLSIHH